MRHFVLLLFVSSLIFSCSNGNLNDFKRLDGNWVANDLQGKFVENWKYINDTLMRGSSYMIQGTDTVFTENLQLVLSDDIVYYIPTVSDQNDGKSIRFQLLSKKENEWVFENKKHDFPTNIIYSFIGSDSLIATVQGKENGKFQKYTFRLKKF